MRWWRRLFHRSDPSVGADAADAAIASAQRRVDHVKSRSQDVTEVSSEIRQFREENHFVDKLRVTMRRT